MENNESLSREEIWQALDTPFDLVVIGGGITGAGVFCAACSRGYKTLLLEQADFAWGTSSRSSKLVHGGLRYLRQGKLCLTYESLHEREWLVQESRGLVTELPLLLPTYSTHSKAPSRSAIHLGLALYDLLAKGWRHRDLSAHALLQRLPELESGGLRGGFWFHDAQVDDARLTVNIIQRGNDWGGLAQNYAQVKWVRQLPHKKWHVCVRDRVGDQTVVIESKVVVNATGVWADKVPVVWKEKPLAPLPLRPLRGSHLVFPHDRLPVKEGVMLFHPQDGRPVFILPWEGATLIGTTDLDHTQDLSEEPHITSPEVNYLFVLLDKFFPRLSLSPKDVLSVYSGVRPVISNGQKDPSAESRAEKIIHKNGYIAVSGGKLTTFRAMANKVMRRVESVLPLSHPKTMVNPWFEDKGTLPAVSDPHSAAGRFFSRYRPEAADYLKFFAGHCSPILETPFLWVELLWAAEEEAVVHLDDLLLRRTRVGLLTPQGGQGLLPQIRKLCQPVLGWDDARWEEEQKRYVEIWKRSYAIAL
ncbi:MAG: glycerol-3-phosphate dehydrogenase/oxidase [Gammaproteobacteria bacterium]|nr:glycerol-3-phosphate dehydrogenase/oxidase [Gammaproteobacteria bacterium]